MAPHSSPKSKQLTQKKTTKRVQNAQESTSTDGHLPPDQTPSPEPLDVDGNHSLQTAAPSITVPQRYSRQSESQNLNSGGTLSLNTNLPQKSLNSRISMSRNPSTNVPIASSKLDTPPNFSPITLPDVAETEDACQVKTNETLPADNSKVEGLLAHEGAGMGRHIQIWEEDSGETEHWSSLAQPDSADKGIPPFESAGWVWAPADALPEINGHGANNSPQKCDVGKTMKAKLHEWERSIPNLDAAEDDEETSDDELGEEATQEHRMNNVSQPQDHATLVGSENKQITLPSSSSSQNAQNVTRLRKQLQNSLIQRNNLDHEVAMLCAQRHNMDQEIAGLCASLGTPNEPGRAFDWRNVLPHLEQQLHIAQGQRTKLREQGEGTAPLDVEVVRRKEKLGLPFEAGFVAKRVITTQEEESRKRLRID